MLPSPLKRLPATLTEKLNLLRLEDQQAVIDLELLVDYRLELCRLRDGEAIRQAIRPRH